jgi:NADH-quinone oxidoreductase subunit N
MFNVLFNILFCFQLLLSFVAIGSIFIGAFGALKQVRIKRFIAYTSINQVGFLILGIASCNLIGLIGIFLYLIMYAIMNILFFSIILNTEHIITQRSMIYLSDFYMFSLFNNENSKYLILTLMSMAGLPPLGGFIGKLFLYFAIIEARLDYILILSLVISILSTYYYLGLVRHILFEKCYNLKLYYYIKKNNINKLLNFFSIILISFSLLLPYIFPIIISFSLSCI